jgi:hypothetical protein
MLPLNSGQNKRPNSMSFVDWLKIKGAVIPLEDQLEVVPVTQYLSKFMEQNLEK